VMASKAAAGNGVGCSVGEVDPRFGRVDPEGACDGSPEVVGVPSGPPHPASSSGSTSSTVIALRRRMVDLDNVPLTEVAAEVGGRISRAPSSRLPGGLGPRPR